MSTSKDTKSVPRNGYAAALRTKRTAKFRHKGDRRPQDARRNDSKEGW